MPRWGFPRVGWRRPVLFTASVPSDAERMRVLAGSVVPVLWLVAVVAAVAAGAEVWRYTILLDSRFDAVPAAPLRASDALVVTTGWLALVSGGLAVLLGLEVLGVITLPVGIALFLFEVGLVATLQAFIFATLTAIYLGGAVAEHH